MSIRTLSAAFFGLFSLTVLADCKPNWNLRTEQQNAQYSITNDRVRLPLNFDFGNTSENCGRRMLLKPVNDSQLHFRHGANLLQYRLLDQQNQPLTRVDSQHYTLLAERDHTPIWAIIEKGVFSPPGRYSSIVSVQNIDGKKQTSHLHFEIPPIALLGMQGESLSSIINRDTHYSIDLGEIHPGKQHVVPLVLRANTKVTIEFKSENGGLKHAKKDSMINYQVAMVDRVLSPKHSTTFPFTPQKQGNETPLDMTITILDGATAPAGEYKDQFTITINAN
ncbi:hypothetical protein ACPV5L_11370 [Vibrio astriarenae]